MTDPRAVQLAESRYRNGYGPTVAAAWDQLDRSVREYLVNEAAGWLAAAAEAGLIDRPTPKCVVFDQAAQQQRVTRARHEGAIEALRSAAEHMDIGAAVGPVPHEVRPVVVRWLRRLADQRLGRAQREARETSTTATP